MGSAVSGGDLVRILPPRTWGLTLTCLRAAREKVCSLPLDSHAGDLEEGGAAASQRGGGNGSRFPEQHSRLSYPQRPLLVNSPWGKSFRFLSDFLNLTFVKPAFCQFIFLCLSDVKEKGIWSCWLWHEWWNLLSWERSGLAAGWGPLGLTDPKYTPGWSQASISQVPINQ